MIQEFSGDITYNMLSSRRSYVHDFHLHNFYELFLLLEGELNFYIHQSFYHITSGTLMVINDLEIHKNMNIRNTPYNRIYIHIPPEFFHKHPTDEIDLTACFKNRNIGEDNLIMLNDTQLKYFVHQYNHIKETENYLLPGKKLLLETYLLQLLVFVNNLSSKQTNFSSIEYPKDTHNIINYLEQHLLENITLDSLAEHLSLSKYYLCHIFKKETGTTIFNYLLIRRIAKSKVLLSEGGNVTEACYQSGFNNYTNFITSFKKITGYTPKKYQKLQLEMLDL